MSLNSEPMIQPVGSGRPMRLAMFGVYWEILTPYDLDLA